jgi:porphobilinogen deaminase
VAAQLAKTSSRIRGLPAGAHISVSSVRQAAQVRRSSSSCTAPARPASTTESRWTT